MSVDLCRIWVTWGEALYRGEGDEHGVSSIFLVAVPGHTFLPGIA